MKRFSRAVTDKLHISQIVYSSAAVVALSAGPVLWSNQAFAQDVRDEMKEKDPIAGDMADENPTVARDLLEEGPDITVQQQRPTVTVNQPRPTVTVTQKPPRVTVQQPAPVIRVNMPEPQVSIKQPQPDVQIKMPKPTVSVKQAKPTISFNRAPPDVELQAAKPRVQIQEATAKVQFEQAPKPMVTVEQSRPQVTVERAQQQAPALAGMTGNNLMSMTGNELVGQQVVDASGKPIGEIVDMVVSKQNNSINAVVDAGGTGSGSAKGVVLPVHALDLAKGKLESGMSEQALQKAPAYNEGQYQPIQLGMPISEFAAVMSGKK